MKVHSKPNLKTICYLIIIFGVFSFGFMFGLIFNLDSKQCKQLVTNSDSKQDLTSVDKILLVVVVFSSVSNTERRDAIRETWLRLSADRKIKHYFIVGTLDLNESQLNSLYTEQRLHNDLVLFPHLKDTYSSLSHKLLSTLKWFSHKIEFNYLVKVDDDSFLRVDLLFDELLERTVSKTDPKPLYLGFFDGRAHVKRSGHWSEQNWILCDRYLPYALGGGYVISEELVDFVAENARLLQLFVSEDVSLGVWLSPLNINRIHDIRFDTEYMSRGCLNRHIITHKQSPKQLNILYKNLQTFGKLCKTEIETKYSYEYNWNTQPSLCCHRNVSLKSVVK